MSLKFCFRVTQNLEIQLVKIKQLLETEKLKIKSSFAPPVKASTSNESSFPYNQENTNLAAKRVIESSTNDLADAVENEIEAPAVGSKSSARYLSKQEYLSNLRQHFHEIVVGGMEIRMRKKVARSIKEKVLLKGRRTRPS